MSKPEGSARRTGRVGWIVLVVLVVVAGIGGCTATGVYNRLVERKEDVNARLAEVQNQYKRRFDLVPQLVETVKGAANFEKSTITQVTEARASVGSVEIEPGDATPDQLRSYFEAQEGLSSALSRLLVVAENYPQLRASQNFLALQDQLEGTENRIAVARRDYLDSVRAYNVAVRRFPTNLLAGMFGHEPLPQLEFDEDVSEAPEVDFETG